MKTNILIITNKLHLLIIFLLIEFVLAPISLYAKDFIIISEVMYDSPLNEQIATGIAYSNGEFIELYNAGTEWTSLNGWSLKGGGSTEIYQFPANTVLAPNSYLIVAYQYNNSSFTLDQLYTGFTTSPDHQVQYQRKIILSNSGEALKLINVSGKTKDSLYIDGTINKTKPYRLSATNTDSIAGNSCVSLQRMTATFDINGVAITNNQEWTTALVNPFIQYITHNISSISNIPASSNYGTITVSNGQNYIQSRNYTDKNAGTFLDQIEYFDGLGRYIQTVQKGITPGTIHYDLATYTEYDNAGRETKQWLPILSSGGFVNLSSFNQGSTLYSNDQHAYTETHYEASPLNRVDWQQGPGSAWQGHHVSTAYETNASTEVMYFTVSGTSLIPDGFYNASTLYKITVTDEDGNPTTEYKDKLGRVVMKRGFTDEDGNHDTYYVYNDLGQLCFVLPPYAADASGSPDAINKYGYVYQYDERGNCTYKKLPGCEPINMTYYPNNLLETSQDGNQLAKNEKLSYVYDELNRLVSTSLESNSTSTSTVLTENYYDNYSFISNSNLSFVTMSGYDGQYSSAKGLLTGTRTRILDNSNTYIYSAIYYDYRGLPVQTRSTNHLGGYDFVYNAYNFFGKPDSTLKVHNVSSTINAPMIENYGYDYNLSPINENYIYSYDQAGRLLTTKYKLNNLPGVLLADQMYDELGRLVSKKRHNNTDTVSYVYNIRNWTTKINSGNFEENIYYNSNPVNSNLCYNGNISYSDWTHINYSNGDKDSRAYLYKYDKLNRLKDANFKQGTSLIVNGSFDENFTYDKQGNIKTLKRKKDNVLFDDLTMNYALEGEKGNQIQSINDNSISQNLYNLKEYTNKSNLTTAEFVYDANGNLIKDLDRDIITIQYNVLNLPEVVQFRNGNQIRNLYDANGKRIQSIYFNFQPSLPIPLIEEGEVLNPNYTQGLYLSSGIAYLDNVLYDISRDVTYNKYSLYMIQNTEGYVTGSIFPNPVNSRLGIQYNYFRQNHLGNNCEVWRASYYDYWGLNNATTIQSTQYYPSGLPWASGGLDYPDAQPYKYNGKEFVEMNGYDVSDLGWRTLHHAKFRFDSFDPDAEFDYDISPYAACHNNPIMKVDPNGRWVETAWDVFSLATGAKSFVDNVRQGNVGAAILDGVGVVADAVAVVIPLVPGGVGAGIKAIRVGDEAFDAAKTVLETNKTIGKVGEEMVTKGLKKEVGDSKTVLTQITGKFPDGKTTKFDNVVVDKKTGKVTMVNETKTGNAKYSEAQERYHKKGETVTFTGKKAEAARIKGQQTNTNTTESRTTRVKKEDIKP